MVVLTVLTAGGKRVSAATPKAVYTQEEPRATAGERELARDRCCSLVAAALRYRFQFTPCESPRERTVKQTIEREREREGERVKQGHGVLN